MFKRILSLSLTMLLLVAVLAACASPAASNAPASSSAPAASGGAAPAASSAPAESSGGAAVAGMEGWEPFANRVSITVPVYDRSKEGYPAVDNNYWTKWVQSEFGDKWNVDVKYVAIPRGDVMTKYSLLIAGGETPTIMMEYDYPKVAQWASDGAMQPIDLNAFKAVAPNFYQAMDDNKQLGYTDINGETFFVLTERPYYDTDYTYGTFVRMDWLRQVGYDHVPQNYAEYTDALDKIIAAGLTKNPLGLGIPTNAYAKNFEFRDHPVDEAEWAQHSSLGTASLSWEPTKKWFKRYNDEYNKGYYSSEFDLEKDTGGQATDQRQTDFINGKLYRYDGYMSANVEWLKAFYEKNPGAELALESVYYREEPGVVDQVKTRANNPFGMIVGFSHLATEDQLKAAWMLMEWMLQDDVLFTLENGVEGVTYTIGTDGLPVVDADYRGEEMLNHNMNIDMTCLVHAAKKVGTIEQTIGQISPQGLPQDFTQAMLDNYHDLKDIADAGRSYSDPVFAVAIDAEGEYSATLLSLYQEYFAQLVKAAPGEFDAVYDKLSKQYVDAGYQEIINERLEAYNNGMTTKLPK